MAERRRSASPSRSPLAASYGPDLPAGATTIVLAGLGLPRGPGRPPPAASLEARGQGALTPSPHPLPLPRPLPTSAPAHALAAGPRSARIPCAARSREGSMVTRRLILVCALVTRSWCWPARPQAPGEGDAPVRQRRLRRRRVHRLRLGSAAARPATRTRCSRSSSHSPTSATSRPTSS